ncbi:MAG: hypothetical protein HUU57_07290 [Bdellovibrio sp.]|nr:hypothetical protein [Bdellovibrio sp.]
MERLNKNSLRFPAKLFTFAFASLGLMLTLASCGNKGGNDYVAPVVPPIYGNGCTNCAGSFPSPVVLTTFEMQSGDGNIKFTGMQMTAESTKISPNYSGNNYRNYSGPIAIQGTMTVASQETDYTTGCVLQPGSYAVNTYSVGQMGFAGGDIVIPTVVTADGLTEMRVDEGVLTSATRLYAYVTFTRLNGVACAMTKLFN